MLKEDVDITTLNYSNRQNHASVQDNLNNRWLLIRIFGHLELSQRTKTWNLINYLRK